MAACCVPGCESKYFEGSTVTFYKFPDSQELLLKWLHAMHCERKAIKDNSYVCSLHFRTDDFIDPEHPKKMLAPLAIPKVYSRKQKLQRPMLEFVYYDEVPPKGVGLSFTHNPPMPRPCPEIIIIDSSEDEAMPHCSENKRQKLTDDVTQKRDAGMTMDNEPKVQTHEIAIQTTMKKITLETMEEQIVNNEPKVQTHEIAIQTTMNKITLETMEEQIVNNEPKVQTHEIAIQTTMNKITLETMEEQIVNNEPKVQTHEIAIQTTMNKTTLETMEEQIVKMTDELDMENTRYLCLESQLSIEQEEKKAVKALLKLEQSRSKVLLEGSN